MIDEIYSVSQVWSGVFSGSCLMDDPYAWMEKNKIDQVTIASRTGYFNGNWTKRTGAPGLVNLFAFEDAELTPAQLYKITRHVVTIPKTFRVAFLCHAGKNRSALMTALWFHWHHPKWLMRDVVREIRHARDPVRVLTNPWYSSTLLTIDDPLNHG